MSKKPLRNILRTAVIATNPVWPFSKLNKLPYYLAIKLFIRICSHYPPVKSVYLRHSLVDGSWVPGVSDIDLTIIINSGLSAQEEFEFLESFWKKYTRLQKYFSMIGEVEVYDDRFIKVWTKMGIKGYESKYWKLVYGLETINYDNEQQSPQRANEAFNYAIRYYRNCLKEILFRSKLDLIRFHRWARKTLKYINYGNDNHPSKEVLTNCNKEHVLCYLILNLTEALKLLGGPIGESRRSDEMCCEADKEDALLASLDLELLESVIIVNPSLLHLSKYPDYVLVFKDGIELEQMKICVTAILKKFTGFSKPFILTYPIFYYMLRHEDPCRYYEIIHHAQIIHGKNLIKEIPPPDENSLLAAVLDHSMNVFTYPRRKRIIFPPEGEQFSNSLYFIEILRETLSTLLYLEARVLIWDLKGLMVKYEEIFPFYYERIIRLKEAKSNQACYLLLRDLANDVYERIFSMKGFF